MEAAGSTKLTKPQILAFTAAWLGWAFDGLDGFMYALIAKPFVGKLMNLPAADPEVGTKAALIQAVFLVGWALGGAVFGWVGDKIGRTKTLNLTIIFYAVFTGLAFFATEWWHLLIFRFLAALGIGGEWAAGAALVSETMPARFRHWASAILQSGYMTGMILAAFTVKALKDYPHNYIFLVGVLPAFFTLWIRKAVPEPDEWAEKSQTEKVSVRDLFSRDVRATTLKVLSLSTICLLGAWTIIYFAPALTRSLPAVAKMSKAEADNFVGNSVIVFTLWNIAGNFFCALVTKYIGYRNGFVAMLTIAMAVFIYGFSQPRSLEESQFWINSAAFFGLGVFSAFPLYFPPLFPTLLRTTGAGFCYNAGRMVTAVGTLYAGSLAPQQTFYLVGFLYIPAILIAFFMPELPKEKSPQPAT
jgi:MFS family permease